MLVSPGTEHDYGTVGTYWETWWAHFQPRRDWHAWWSLPQAMPGLSYVRLTRPSETDRLVSAFARLHRDAQRAGLSPTGDTELHLLEKNLAVQLTMNGIEEVLLIATSSLRKDTRQLDSRVQLVLDAVTSDPSRPYTLTSLAGLAQVSVSRLAHLFKEQVGDSIMNVVVGLRLAACVRVARCNRHVRRADRPRGRLRVAALLQPAIRPALRLVADEVPAEGQEPGARAILSSVAAA